MRIIKMDDTLKNGTNQENRNTAKTGKTITKRRE
jgi:hypothetical protein